MRDLPVFLICGQSNAGLWFVQDVAPDPADAVFAQAWGQWPMPVPSPADPRLTRFANGPGMAFGRALARAGVPAIGIVGCMWGGSLIGQWAPGEVPYEDCLKKARSVERPLSGILFCQGEADANTTVRPDGGVRHPANWDCHFGYFVASLRADLGQRDLPVVLGRLAHPDLPTYANWALVRSRQDLVSIPRVALVEPEEARIGDSGIHLDDASYARVGERMAAAYLTMTRT